MSILGLVACGDELATVPDGLATVPANAGCRTATPDFVTNRGVRVYRAEVGVPTRNAWTMYSYHGTNVADDGNVPVTEQDHWTPPGGSGFRQGQNL